MTKRWLLNVCRTLAVAVLSACVAEARAEGPTGMWGEKTVLPAGDPAIRHAANRRAPFAFRLSPDGKYVLRVRPDEGADPQAREAAEQLVVREVATGKDTVVPVPLPPGMASVLVRFGFFEPAGRQLAVIGAAPDGARQMQVVMLDVQTGKTTPTPIVGPQVMGRFDRTGKRLLISSQIETSIADLPELKQPKKLALAGFVQSVCPTADVVCGFVPPAPQARLEARQAGLKAKHALVLFDYAADKEVARLPVHPRNSVLDDVETQWTTDGRYLFYVDYEEAAGGGGPVQGARVWDRTAGQPVAFIPGTTAVGAGPTPTTMVLNGSDAQKGRAAVLYDAAKSAAMPLGDGTTEIIHATGGLVLFLKGAGDQAELRIARIETRRSESLR